MKQKCSNVGSVSSIHTHRNAGFWRSYLVIMILICLGVDVGLGQATCGNIDFSFTILQEINGSGNKSVNVNWVRVLNNDCQGGADLELLNEIIESVETTFGNHGISLNRISCSEEQYGINQICNSTLYVASGDNSICLFDDFCDNNTLNVFLLPPNANLGNKLGLAKLPGNLCIAKVLDLTSSVTLIHEIGHCFGLFHTSGDRKDSNPLPGTNKFWVCTNPNPITANPAANTIEQVPSCEGEGSFYWGIFEKVDGSNSNASGDYVVDTPADIAIPMCQPSNNCSTSSTCQQNLNTNINFKDPNCQIYNNIPWTNFMRFQFSNCISEFTTGQESRMKGVLTQFLGNIQTDPCNLCPESASNFCSPCHAGHEHLNVANITGILNITQPTLITENLTINGGTLNVHSELYVAPGKFIYVQNQGILNVGLNGHITSCGTEVWNGVNTNNSTVRVNDGGKISKAFNGIMAIGNNAIICRLAEFFEIQHAAVVIIGNTEASFNNTSFFGMEHGVGVIGSTHITSFINCSFAYQSIAGISSYGSSINVSNNTQFVGCTNAVFLNNNFGTSSNNIIGNSETSANHFTNCNNGVYCVNSTTDIRNNYFLNNEFGLVLRGLNNFQSHNNTFTGASYAEAIDGTGEFSNQSFSNNYSSDVGLYPHNYNRGYNFYNNCFSTLWWDVNAFGVINQSQFGPGNKAAGNCFTKSGVSDFIYSGIPVVYGIPDSPTASDCLFPDNSGNWDYTTQPSIYTATSECGNSFISENQYGYLIRMGCNELRIKKSTDSLKLIVKFLKDIKDRPLTKSEQVLLAKTERHLRFAIAQWAWCLRKEGRRRELKDWYKDWSKIFPDDKYFAINKAEVTAELGEYILSKAELDSISTVHNLHPDILQSLKISVDVLETYESRSASFNTGNDLPVDLVTNLGLIDGRIVSGYILTVPNHQLLRRVATMSVPEAAYGRSLLSYLTGEIIDPVSTIPLANRNKSTLNKTNNQEEIYKMNPNPANQHINIEIEHPKENCNYEYKLTNLTSNVILVGSINGTTLINTSQLSNGVYIVQITKDKIPVDIKKIVIQK